MSGEGRQLGPGRYGLERLRPGDWISTPVRVVTEEMIDSFAELTGDRCEIHMDREAARRSGFGDRVAHGLLVQSLVDGLKNQSRAQVDAAASLGWEWEFTAPVLAGDSVRARIEVRDLRRTPNPQRGIVTLDIIVTNQRGETVQKGVNRIMVPAESGQENVKHEAAPSSR